MKSVQCHDSFIIVPSIQDSEATAEKRASGRKGEKRRQSSVGKASSQNQGLLPMKNFTVEQFNVIMYQLDNNHF